MADGVSPIGGLLGPFHGVNIILWHALTSGIRVTEKALSNCVSVVGSPSEPSNSLSMILLDNGVSQEMTIDYGDYIIKATLKKIQTLKKPAC